MECQPAGPLGESFSGLQGVVPELRSEAKVYVCVGAGGGRGEEEEDLRAVFLTLYCACEC